MPLQATSGAASYDAFGGGVPVVPKYIEDYFSTYLVTGDGTAPAVNNGIDLSTKGGLVWTKKRSAAGSHSLFDTARGANLRLISNDTAAQDSVNLSFTTTGFSNYTFDSGVTYTSWSWAKAPKFFDVVTVSHTNGVADTVDLSGLGTVGCVIVKCTSISDDWYVWHRGCSAGNIIRLNLTDAQYSSTKLSVSGTTLTISSVFATGTYVVYAYAHNAGGFGLTGTDNVISCGSYTGNGSTVGPTVTLGYEPQWVLIKESSASGNQWVLFDNMRGMPVGSNDNYLFPNLSSAESSAYNLIEPTATGFYPYNTLGIVNNSGSTYIYIAIRRGPMKVPTDATKVFYPQAISQADNIDSTGVPFPPDLVNTFSRNGTGRSSTELFQFVDRLRGLGTPNNTFTASAPRLVSSDTSAENIGSSYVQLKADSQNITRGSGWNSASYGNWIDYFWRRAPSFFDEVCYTGTGSARTVTHNLGAVPELMIVKQRSGTTDWVVYAQPIGNTALLALNLDIAQLTFPNGWNNTSPTSTEFTVGISGVVNTSGGTYVAYLFATCAGVSKVGSYTGNGSSQTINCGFTGGARFVMVKATSTTGNWIVADSARGIVAGNDPALYLNSTAAEVTGLDWIDADNSGFVVNETATIAANTNGVSYIFLAIA